MHDYLDVVMNGISTLASNGNEINTIDQAFIFADIKYKEYLHALQSENVVVNADNIKNIIINKAIY